MKKINLFAFALILIWCLGCSSTSGQWVVDSEHRVVESEQRADGLDVEVFAQLGHTDWVMSVIFNHDGKQLISSSEVGTIKLWDIDTGREIRTFLGHTHSANSISLSSDGKQIISGSADKTVKLWDIDIGLEIKTFSAHTGSVNSVCFSPDGKFIISGSDDKTVKLWDIDTGLETKAFSGHTHAVNSISINPNGKHIISCFAGTIKLWDIDTGQEIKTFSNHASLVISVGFSPDGKQIISGSADKTVKLWDIDTDQEIKTFSGHTSSVWAVNFSPNGKQLINGSYDRTITLWDIDIGSKVNAFSGHTGLVRSVSFSPNGKQIISGSWDGTTKLWNIDNNIESITFLGHTRGVNSVNFSPDGKHIISGSSDRTIKLWDIDTSQKIKTFSGQIGMIRSVSFSPNGKHIISGSARTINLWDIDTGQEIKTFSGHTGLVNSISFNPDGKQIISGSDDRTIKLWDIDTGQEVKTFSGHVDRVTSIAFSSNGKQIISGSDDRTIKLWDIDTGKEIKTFSAHKAMLLSLSFSPDDKRILTASVDGTTRLWDVATGKEIAAFISFTDGEWIVITPDGFYNASPKGDQHLNVRIGNEVFGMDQFADTFYQPEVVKARLQGLSDPPIVRQRGSIQTTSIPPAIRVNASDVNPVTRQVTLSVSATDWIRQISNIEIIVNGRRIGGEELLNVTTTNLTTARAQLTPASGEKQFEFTIPLTLDPGANHIEIVASNGYNFGLRPLYLSAPISTMQRKGDLWVFAVGVDRYVNNNADSGYLDLRNASNDARNIAHSFRAQDGKRYDKVHVMCIADNEPILPTKQAIMNNMNEFFNRASPHDTVVLFMSGHGKTEDGIYYFMPRDTVFSGGEKFVLASAISAQELSDALNIPGRKIVMLDTCESGGVDSNRLAHSLRNRSTVVFTASQDGEFALDTGLYGGLLAYSVVEGVGGKAAQAGTVQIEPLGRHVTDRVRELSRDRQSGVVRQTPVVYFPDWYRDFVIAW